MLDVAKKIYTLKTTKANKVINNLFNNINLRVSEK